MTTTNEKRLFIALVTVSVIAFILALKSCEPTPTPTLAVEAKNTEIKYKNKLIEVSKKEDTRKIDDLSNDNKRLLQLLQQSNIDKHKAKKWLKSIENGELADYYNNRLKINDVKTTNNGTEFTDSTLSVVTSQLIDCDYLKRDYATLFKMNNNNDSIGKHYRNLWQKTETQSANNYQMYVNDSTALANVKEVKFRLSAFGMYGNNTTLTNSDYKGGIIVNDKKNRSYIIAVGRDVYYLGFGVKIFEVKGKIKN